MYLLNTTKRKLEEFGGNKIPMYVILSHTWSEKEPTFQDIEGHDAEEWWSMKRSEAPAIWL
jgi:hypothetical protein